jgi:transcriptional regulator GlxA family with amidase domain
MIDVTVLLLGGCYASTALGPVEVFHSAGTLWNVLHGERESPRFRVTTAALRSKRVMSPYGVGLLADAEIREVRATDLIIVPSAGLDLDAQLVAHRELYPWLRRHAAKGAYIAGVCAGAAYLAEAGLLDGREATTHWASAQELRRRFPAVNWCPDKMITEDRRVLCSGGVYASMDLSLYLVEKFCGHEIALQTAKSLVINMPRARQDGYAVLPLSRPHDDDTIRSAEASIERNFKCRLRVEDLARERHMSPRNFIRRFKTATGRTPGDYLQATRIAIAKQLLESGARSVQAVCGAVGYEDPAFFRALFKRHTGMSPAEYREHFGRTPTATKRRQLPRGTADGHALADVVKHPVGRRNG